MNMNWITMIGGGFAAAATLTAGISMSGLFSPAASTAPATATGETIYVEQPLIEVGAPDSSIDLTTLPPKIIAIIPAASSDDSASSAIDAGGSLNGAVDGAADPAVVPTPPSEESEGDDDSIGDDESGEVDFVDEGGEDEEYGDEVYDEAGDDE